MFLTPCELTDGTPVPMVAVVRLSGIFGRPGAPLSPHRGRSAAQPRYGVAHGFPEAQGGKHPRGAVGFTTGFTYAGYSAIRPCRADSLVG